MRSYPWVLTVLFVGASLLLLGGRVAQAREAAEPAPTSEPLVVTAAEAPAGAPTGLVLQTTVGQDPSCLGATEVITVPAGTPVTFCYHVTNYTGFTLTAHTLRDVFGENLLNEVFTVLPSGGSTDYKRSVVLTGSVTNLATWTATQPITSYSTAVGSCGVFPDISGTGQALHLSDDGMVNLTLPFAFPFYDRYGNRLRVSNNGAVLFDEISAGVGFGNVALPTAGLPHGLAVFWDDLDEKTGEVYAGLYTTTAADQAAAGWQPQGSFTYYVIEYRQRSHFSGPTDPGTFALMLLAPGQGNDGYVQMCYQDTGFGNSAYNSGASATIGLNHNGSTATQFSFNTAHAELTGTYGIGYSAIGPHQAFAAGDSARANAVTTINLPVISR